MDGLIVKRRNIKYDDYISIENIIYIYKIVKKNTKNKKKIALFEDYFSINITNIYNILKSKSYDGGVYNTFKIYEPKERIIKSQNIKDKIINHFVSYYFLFPMLESSLINSNVATRKGKGTSYGIKLLKRYLKKDDFILKCDITKFFNNIDHDILKKKILKKIKDKDILEIVNTIIDSTEGLPIGNLSSQILAIFYLNEMDHFIKEKLKIKRYIRYMDDFVLIHEDKEYLKYCLKQINKFLNKEKLTLNNKTMIININNGLTFLGYRFIYNDKLIIKVISKNKRKILKKLRNLKKYDYSKYLLSKASYKGYLNIK